MKAVTRCSDVYEPKRPICHRILVRNTRLLSAYVALNFGSLLRTEHAILNGLRIFFQHFAR